MRCGRRRKFGSRESNGRLQRISAAGRDANQTEMVTVLRQSHRLGSTEQLLESPIGRFVLRDRLGREYYDSALEFGCLCRHYFAALGVTRFINEGHRGSGLGVSPAKTRVLAREVERLETALQKLNPSGFAAMRSLAVFENEIAPQSEPGAVVVLLELGKLLRKTGRR